MHAQPRAKYEGNKKLAGGPTARSEAQLRSTADGNYLSGLWMQQDGLVTDVYFRTGINHPDVKK